MEYRTLPQSIEAEESVLGCLISNGNTFDEIVDIITADDFCRDDNKEIYAAVAEMYGLNETIDLITIENKLKTRGSLDNTGGIQNLVRLTDKAPIVSNVKRYAEIVKEKSVLRKLIKTSTDIINVSYEQSEPVENIVQMAESQILNINESKESDMFTAAQALESALMQIDYRVRNKGKITGVPTGFTDLDFKLGGMQNGDLIVIAARPSMGKTALAENISTYVSAIKQTPTAFFSMEMKKEKIVNRQLSELAKVDNQKIKLGLLDDADFHQLAQTYGIISDSKLTIVDKPNLKPAEIRAKCRRIKRKYGSLGLIVVDHLLEMWRPHKGNDVQEYSENVRAMKRLASEMNCPVILLAQASRGCEARNDKRPNMSDLKECGTIEEVADVVMFIYRDDYYNPNTDKKNVAEIIIAKGRDVGTGTVELVWMGQYTKFVNLDKVRG